MERAVRCSKGHVFTSTWMRWGSFKALRFGFARFERCPVGRHWAFIRPADMDSLSPAEKESAARFHDSRMP